MRQFLDLSGFDGGPRLLVRDDNIIPSTKLTLIYIPNNVTNTTRANHANH